MQPLSAHHIATRKFRPPVPSSAPTSSAHLSPADHPPVPSSAPTCAQQFTHLCHSAVSHTCAQKCHLPVPSSATHLCPPTCAHQCHPPVPTHQCHPPVQPSSAASQCH
ncbi:unnamed protein product, partial [Staurois parvus]